MAPISSAKHYFCRLYRLGGTVGRGLYSAAFVHPMATTEMAAGRWWAPRMANSAMEADSLAEEAGFEPPVPPSPVSLQERNCLLRKSVAPSFEPSRGWRFRTGRKLPYDAEVLDFSNRANFFVTAPRPL